jgi:Fur family transcriptional regulator, peroxide stress response regulator
MNLNKQILETFNSPEAHPKASDIFELLKKQAPDVKIEELQMTLDELEKNGQIRSILHLDKQKHYHTRQDHHSHFICAKCGQVKDVVLEEGAINMIKVYVQKQIHSFGKIDQVNLSFQGTCHNCRENNK